MDSQIKIWVNEYCIELLPQIGNFQETKLKSTFTTLTTIIRQLVTHDVTSSEYDFVYRRLTIMWYMNYLHNIEPNSLPIISTKLYNFQGMQTTFSRYQLANCVGRLMDLGYLKNINTMTVPITKERQLIITQQGVELVQELIESLNNLTLKIEIKNT